MPMARKRKGTDDEHLIGTRLSTELRDRLQAVAREEQRSVAAELRLLIQRHVERKEKDDERVTA